MQSPHRRRQRSRPGRPRRSRLALQKMLDSTVPGGALVDARVLARFEERIAADLDLYPLVADADELRRGAAALVPRAGGVSHYELLGVSVGATTDEIHAAYREL